MRQNESPPYEEKAQDAIGFDLELKDLICFGQMLKLAFILDLPHIPHTHEQGCKLLLALER